MAAVWNKLTLTRELAFGRRIVLVEAGGTQRPAVESRRGHRPAPSEWWLTLSGIVGLARERFTSAWMRWVNRLSGLVIFGFGAVILVGAFALTQGL